MNASGRALALAGGLLIFFYLISDLRFPLPSDEEAEVDFTNSDFNLFHNRLLLAAGIILVVVPIVRSRQKKLKFKRKQLESFPESPTGDTEIGNPGNDKID
jgi:hypothetical protein